MTEIFNMPLSPDVELVRRYGGPVSHAALDPSRCIFRAPGIDGLIGFLPTHRSAWRSALHACRLELLGVIFTEILAIGCRSCDAAKIVRQACNHL